MVILLVDLEVLGELREPLRQQRHLDLSGPGVRPGLLVGLDHALLGLSGDQLRFLSIVTSIFTGRSS